MPKQTSQEVVLQRLREGSLCSQGFFHEDKHLIGLTHRVAATVGALKKKGHDIRAPKGSCWHGRKKAVHYSLVEQKETLF